VPRTANARPFRSYGPNVSQELERSGCLWGSAYWRRLEFQTFSEQPESNPLGTCVHLCPASNVGLSVPKWGVRRLEHGAPCGSGESWRGVRK
jgi:hypothetical protein